jgi:hypothetical protein
MFAELRRGVAPLAFLLTGVAAALTPGEAAAQEREILFNQVTVSSAEASLVLELTDDEAFSVTLRDGRILVDGEEVGRYARGGELERSWRALLSEAIALESDALAELLRAWSPPAGLEGDALRGAGVVEERITTALAAPATAPAERRAQLRPEQEAEAFLEALVRDPARLRELAAAIRNLPVEGLRIHVGESVEVAEGETVAGSILLLDGNLTLAGRVEGDVVLLGGRAELGEGARVEGDLRWADARVEGNRGAVTGRIREILPVADRPEVDLREEIRREIQEATARALGEQRPPPRPRASAFPRNLARGIGGLFQTLVTFVILMGAGLAALYFFPRNLEVVARTARNAPARSAMVGLAGVVLAFPVWLLGLLVLAVSIIGIPVALLWIPAFPLALALAVGLGYLAVARNLGRWAAGRDIQGLDSLDTSRPAAQLGLGLAVLLAAFALAYVFQIGGPWFGIFRGLLLAAGTVLTVLVGCVGLGAVLISRGGQDPAFAGIGWAWEPDHDPWAPEPDPFAPEAGPAPTGSDDPGETAGAGARKAPGAEAAATGARSADDHAGEGRPGG